MRLEAHRILLCSLKTTTPAGDSPPKPDSRLLGYSGNSFLRWLSGLSVLLFSGA